MTLNDLIREAQRAAMNFSSGDIPVTIKGKEVDIDFDLVGDGTRYFAEINIREKK